MKQFCISIILILLGVPSFVFAQPDEISSTIEGGRGLMYMQSARTYGKGSLITGVKGLVLSRELPITDESGFSKNQLSYPVVIGLPVTFGLTDEVDVTAGIYGFNDARTFENPSDVTAGYGSPVSGFGSARLGAKIRMPLSMESRIQIAGKFAALIDTSREQIDGMNYRWSRIGTDIETSIYESFDLNRYMSLHFEQGYVVSGSDVYDDQIVGAAGLQIHIKRLLTFNFELANRTFLGVSPYSAVKAGNRPYMYESVNDMPQAGNPVYVKDNDADYFDDFFVFSPSVIIRLNDNVSMDLGANINIADHDEPRENIQALAGLTFKNEIKSMIDSDQDGVNNKFDREPNTPPGYPVDAEGVSLDTDGDGVPDGADRESDTPQGARVNRDGVGLDGDGDGVNDGLDMEPDTPPGCKVDQFGVAFDDDRDGVPNCLDMEASTPLGAIVGEDGVAVDSDGDGVPDGIDVEADTPRGAHVFRNGASIDNDSDGVPDGIDVEPSSPPGVLVDREGRALVRDRSDLLVHGTIQNSTIYFVAGSSEIDVDSKDILNEIASLLLKYPALKIRISGHADSSSESANSYEISRMRALNVRDYFVSNYPEIAKSRLIAVGFGSEKPQSKQSAVSDAGGNRRVEFAVIDQ